MPRQTKPGFFYFRGRFAGSPLLTEGGHQQRCPPPPSQNFCHFSVHWPLVQYEQPSHSFKTAIHTFMEVDDDPHDFCCHRCSCWGVLRSTAAQAYQAPYCAVINLGTGSIYWDCQYSSFDDCYRRGNILAGNRGWCNPSPYYVAGYAEQSQTRKRHARPQ